MNIKLATSNLQGFDEETATNLLNAHFESAKRYWQWREKCYKREFGQAEGKGYAKIKIKNEKESLNLKEVQEGILFLYGEIKNAILKNKLVVRYCGGDHWSVEYVKDNNIKGIGLILKDALCSYKLNYNTGYYTINCYGSSRPLEIIMDYGHRLGLKEIPQNQIILY